MGKPILPQLAQVVVPVTVDNILNADDHREVAPHLAVGYGGARVDQVDLQLVILNPGQFKRIFKDKPKLFPANYIS